MNSPLNVPTLADVAVHAGVSRMTVSRVLRNSPNVRPETARRVRASVKAVGYRPDAEVARLMSYLSRHHREAPFRPVIALIHTIGPEGVCSAPRTTAAARERAEELGYRLEEFWAVEGGMSAARLSTVLRTRNIQCVIVPPTGAVGGRLELDWKHFAAVAIGFSLSWPPIDRVDQNHYHAALQLMRQVSRLGHKRIGIVDTTPSEIRLEFNYLAGFLVHQATQEGVDAVPPLILEQLDEIRFRKWMERHRPEVVLGFDTRLPEWIRSLGLSIPRDVGYARLIVKPLETELSGVLLNAVEIGRAAVDAVVGKLHRNEFGIPDEPRVTLVEGKWNPGKSLRKKSRTVRRSRE